MMVPFIWAFTSALKDNGDIFTYPPVFFPSHPHWEHFVDGWHRRTVGGGPDLHHLHPQLAADLTLITWCGTVVSCIIVAYGFARFRFPLRNLLFLVMLSTMMIP